MYPSFLGLDSGGIFFGGGGKGANPHLQQLNRHTQPGSGVSLQVYHHRKWHPMVVHETKGGDESTSKAPQNKKIEAALCNTIAYRAGGQYNMFVIFPKINKGL